VWWVQNGFISIKWKTNQQKKSSNKIKEIKDRVVVTEADVDRNWEQIRRAINSVATMILGKKTSKTKPWFNRICEEVIERIKAETSNWLNDTNNQTLFNRYKTR